MPPKIFALIMPSQIPKQEASVWFKYKIDGPAISFNPVACILVQPLASRMVTEYTPAETKSTTGTVANDGSLQLYVNGFVPPPTVS